MSALPVRSRIHQAALQLFAERGAAEVSVSDLAQAAGVARGTIYNNIQHPDQLFGEVAADLAREMYSRSVASMVGVDDPAHRLAIGLRLFMRRTHEEPHWGRFIVRFSLVDSVMNRMMGEPPTVDIAQGVEIGRYSIEKSYLPIIAALVSGSALSSMRLVLDGHLTWRDAGSQVAELNLRALGIEPSEARAISTLPLPPLAEIDGERTGAGSKSLKSRKARSLA